MIEQVKIGYYLLTAEEESQFNRVEVMAIAKNYVMWRRRGCLPQVYSIKSMLEFLNNKKAVPGKKKAQGFDEVSQAPELLEATQLILFDKDLYLG